VLLPLLQLLLVLQLLPLVLYQVLLLLLQKLCPVAAHKV
jgi:hypothetical protein